MTGKRTPTGQDGRAEHGGAEQGGTAAEPDGTAEQVLFAESGARWRLLWFGPVFCILGLIVEIFSGGPVHWVPWLVIAGILTVLVSVQVYAGRMHTSVELTATHLRQGTETVPLSRVVHLFDPPPADRARDDPREPWESARALGELVGVPRRRRGIGLRLADGRLVQAWARDHETLRAELTRACTAVHAKRRRSGRRGQAE